MLTPQEANKGSDEKTKTSGTNSIAVGHDSKSLHSLQVTKNMTTTHTPWNGSSTTNWGGDQYRYEVVSTCIYCQMYPMAFFGLTAPSVNFTCVALPFYPTWRHVSFLLYPRTEVNVPTSCNHYFWMQSLLLLLLSKSYVALLSVVASIFPPKSLYCCQYTVWDSSPTCFLSKSVYLAVTRTHSKVITVQGFDSGELGVCPACLLWLDLDYKKHLQVKIREKLLKRKIIFNIHSNIDTVKPPTEQHYAGALCISQPLLCIVLTPQGLQQGFIDSLSYLSCGRNTVILMN